MEFQKNADGCGYTPHISPNGQKACSAVFEKVEQVASTVPSTHSIVLLGDFSTYDGSDEEA